MKKYYIITLMALLAIFIGAYIFIGDFAYEIDMKLFHVLDKGDGLYCSPHMCVDVIHDHDTLYHMSMDYMKIYGHNDPGRPSLKYKYNSDMHAYIRYLKY